MFKLELLDLLREYKNADEYKQKKILHSLSKLLKEHKEEAEVFLQSAGINEEQKQILHQAYLIDESDEEEETETEESDKEKVEKSNDFAIVKSYYKKWLKCYKGEEEISEEAKKIIDDMITYYAESKPEVFFKLFEMTHDQNFEKFKFVLKNTLRVYYMNKIKNYRLSTSYRNLSWLKKRKVRASILRIYSKLGSYEFPITEIRGVLNGYN